MNERSISLLVCALGGEGGGVLTEWLVEAARHAGYAAQSTSIPGVAQRTGATTYYIEVFPRPLAQLQRRQPVFSLSPVPGALDAIVSSELLETTRQIGNGMASPERTAVITSSGRTLTTQERMQLADGRTDSAELLQVVQAFSREHHVFDMGAVAREAGTVVSAVMLGAVAGSGLFPFRREDYEAVVRAGGKGAEASLRGFAKAFDIVSQRQQQAGYLAQVMGADALDSRLRGNDRASPAIPAEDRPSPAIPAEDRPSPAILADDRAVIPAEAGIQGFPEPVRDMAGLGYARLVEYQGRAYADHYLDRLRRVLQAERQADPAGANDFAITREMARWVALWMAFDDIVRVADLKSRASRWRRVTAEVKAGDDDLLRVYDHFKPGVPEFAALLPPALATRLTAWDRRRVLRGKLPWAMPLKLGTHTVSGMLALRTLAAMRGLRVYGSRFAAEQAMIDKWLAGVVQGTQRGWQLGHEVALCGRLIKGYGATNERGKDNLLHVLDHLALLPQPEAAAQAVAAALAAALADDAGKALDAALVQHGAPPRPVREQPIRFMRRKPAPGRPS